jgi:hypothetical protein
LHATKQTTTNGGTRPDNGCVKFTIGTDKYFGHFRFDRCRWSGGPNIPLNTNSGGGNQHQGNNNPVFSFNDLPIITVQRSSMGTNGSYLVIYQGLVTLNQPSPSGAVALTGSNSMVANPADFYIDFSSSSAVASQIYALSLGVPTATWTIASVEINGSGHAKTDASFQFNFPGLQAVNGKLTPTLNVTTQSGKNG